MRLRSLRLSLGFLVWPATALIWAGCFSEHTVPVHRVERVSFVHKVSADGVLQAGRKTQLSVPPQVVNSVRLAWLLAEGSRVTEGDVVARFDAQSIEEQLADAKADRGQSDLRIVQSQVEKGRRIEDLHADAEIADLELEHARAFLKTDSVVFSRRERMEDAVDEKLAAERKAHAEANAETEQDLAKTELAILDIERRQAVDKIEEANQGLEALEVRAPHAGLLTYVRDWRGEPPAVGGEMFRGQSIAEIPDLESLEAEIYVLEADAGGLAPGLKAEVRVEAHPEHRLTGEVLRVEPVAQPRFRRSPVQYFGVVVSFDQNPEQKKILATMKPGQRLLATLYLERVDDALVVPRQAVYEEDGTSRVWRRSGGGFQSVEVELGATGLGQVVVASGLSEGDEVALRPPSGASDARDTTSAEASTDAGSTGALAENGPAPAAGN